MTTPALRSAAFGSTPGGGDAMQRLLANAVNNGGKFDPNVLRANNTLPRDTWVHFIEQVTREGDLRLNAVRVLMEKGLSRPIENALGMTAIEYMKVRNTQAATRAMSPLSHAPFDAVDYTESQVPNFMTFKDFSIDARTIAKRQMRNGEQLDATLVRDAAQRVAESLEDSLINGSGITVGGNTAYGLINHPNVTGANFEGTGGHWGAAAKTGEQMLTDLNTAIAAAESKRFYGPFAVLVPTNVSTKLGADFKANSDKTIRERLESVDSINPAKGGGGIVVCDQLAGSKMVLVPLDKNYVELADGEAIQPVQWGFDGEFGIRIKVFAIQTPIIKADAQSRLPVVYMVP